MIQTSPIQLEKGTYIGKKVQEHHFGYIITSETTFVEGHNSEWHYHANPHFSHILYGGSKELRQGQSEHNGAGEGLYYYPGIAHRNEGYKEGTRIFNLELEPGFFEQYGLDMPPAALMFECQAQLNARGLIKAMYNHYLHDAESHLAIQQICVSLIHSFKKDEKYFPEWVPKIKAMMHQHWDQTLSLPMLSQALDLHPVTISKYFSRYFDCSAGEYLRRIKVDRAAALIRSNTHSLTAISYLCGFSDQAHFTKTFQRIMGMLPLQYRKL